ncbi:hypothetical protein NDU88_006892 [Pleurodeles waltl]|uniref:Uncharacterized protein n=1 Tax=Pleurodeles waltl TaxID=8319 RepID=A0AAV7N4T0_PLEWA|nr:hypothetical protein NDU88_006892 [Pleurodeles waltl]
MRNAGSRDGRWIRRGGPSGGLQQHVGGLLSRPEAPGCPLRNLSCLVIMEKPRTKHVGHSHPPLESSEETDPSLTSIHLHLAKIVTTIVDMRDTPQQDISEVLVGLGLLQADHCKVADRVRIVETTVEELQPEHKALADQVTDLAEKVRGLEDWAEDAEGWNHRNSFRVV